MPEFSARLDRLEQIADETWNQRQQLDQLAEETRNITSRLKTLTQMEQPLHQLAQCRNALQEQADALGRMSNTLDTVITLYHRTETATLQQGDSIFLPPKRAELVDILGPRTPVSVPQTTWQGMIEDLHRVLNEIAAPIYAETQSLQNMVLLRNLRDAGTLPLSVTVAGVLERCGWWYGNDAARRMCSTGTVAMLDSGTLHQLQT